jgi:hypothetical protein
LVNDAIRKPIDNARVPSTNIAIPTCLIAEVFGFGLEDEGIGGWFIMFPY